MQTLEELSVTAWVIAMARRRVRRWQADQDDTGRVKMFCHCVCSLGFEVLSLCVLLGFEVLLLCAFGFGKIEVAASEAL